MACAPGRKLHDHGLWSPGRRIICHQHWGFALPRGGLGAIIGGTIQLSANYTLNILVGLMGGNSSSYSGGGGGGSFVVNSDPYNNTPLVVAEGEVEWVLVGRSPLFMAPL
jgi:hypothetical protein